MTPDTTKPDPWDTADYYECGDCAEILTHETLEAALESHLDGYLDPECDVARVILGLGGVTVKAYARKEVDARQARRWAKRIAEDLNSWWTDEEYGDPDGDGVVPGTPRFVEELTPVIDAALRRTEVWQCEKVAEKEFSAEQVLAIMRQECPEWFTVAEARP